MRDSAPLMANSVAGAPASRRMWQRRPPAEVLGLASICGVVALLALVPLGYLIGRTVVGDHGVTLENFREAYRTLGLGTMVANSAWFAAGSTLLAVAIGTALAFVIVRTDMPLRGPLFAASLVPLLIPGILHTVAWILLASPRSGWLNRLLEPVLGPETINVFSLGGMVLVEGLHLAPLAFLLMVAAFRSMDPALEEAGLLAGARWPTVLRRITLPPLRPALAASVLVLLVRGLESFEVPALLGIPGGVWVFSSRIWSSLSLFPPRLGQAGALSLSLLVLTSVGVFLHVRLTRHGRVFQTVSGRGFRPRPVALGRWRWVALGAVACYLFVAVVLPLLILLHASTQPFYRSPSVDSLSDTTIANYKAVLASSDTLRSFRHSVVLGIGAATSVVLVCAVAAWVVVRSRVRGRWLLDDLASLPLAMPGLVLGAALLFVYLRSPIPIYGTLWLLFLAYLTRYLPYGMRYASVSMFQIGDELEESARASGATWWKTFRRVVLPLLLPGLAAGWIYVFALSLRELSSSILLYGPGTKVLSVEIWERYESGQFPEMAALGILMVAATVTLGMVAYRLSARLGVAEV